MRRTYARPSKAMKAFFGFNPYVVRSQVSQPGNFVTVDAGWVTLDFGRDATWSEFVLASNRMGSFLFSAEPPAAAQVCSFGGRRDWVDTIDHFPKELFDGVRRPTEFLYAGFRVVHVADRRRRNFIFVGMPGGKINLLFRNPLSRSALAWSPHGAVQARDAIVLKPVEATPVRAMEVFETTGDVDLDEMLQSIYLAPVMLGGFDQAPGEMERSLLHQEDALRGLALTIPDLRGVAPGVLNILKETENA